MRRDADSARGQQQSTGAVIEIEKDRIVSMLRENASALGGVPAASSQPPMGVPVAVATAALDDVLPSALPLAVPTALPTYDAPPTPIGMPTHGALVHEQATTAVPLPVMAHPAANPVVAGQPTLPVAVAAGEQAMATAKPPFHPSVQ